MSETHWELLEPVEKCASPYGHDWAFEMRFGESTPAQGICLSCGAAAEIVVFQGSRA